jgi:hypothetical protein
MSTLDICQLNRSGQATICIPISANNCARRDAEMSIGLKSRGGTSLLSQDKR